MNVPTWTSLTLGGRAVPLLRVGERSVGDGALAVALAAGGLAPGRWPVLVLVGGASGVSDQERARWQGLFRDGLVAGVAAGGGCVLDGGTDTGVMALVGAAREAFGAGFPLIGVVARGTIRWPGRAPRRPDAAALEPHHTHLVAVPGGEWGMESPWLARLATVLAAGAPTVTVVVNGGTITLEDVRHSLAAARRVLAIARTGRAADELVAASRGEPSGAPASPLVTVVDALEHPTALATAVADALKLLS
ncbi:MAG: hypothetical protein ACRDRX_06505 [Pseudonocardiaceae bacterium]